MKQALFLPAFSIALLLSTACNKPSTDAAYQDDPDRIDEYENVTLDKGTLPEEGAISPIQVLEAAEEAGGLTAIPIVPATRILDHYIARLQTVPGAETMIDDLKLIREEINSGIIDRGEVGTALNRLGVQTRLLAQDDPAYLHLGSLLKSAGEQFVGDKMMED